LSPYLHLLAWDTTARGVGLHLVQGQSQPERTDLFLVEIDEPNNLSAYQIILQLRHLSADLTQGASAWYYICKNVMGAQWNHHHRQGPGDHTEGHSRASPVKTGDRVKFFVPSDGSVVLLPKLSASALRGMIKSDANGR